jgi:hypothetical protein
MTTVEKAKQYAALVKQYARNGEISTVVRQTLQHQQKQLQLTTEQAQAIEAYVLQRRDSPIAVLPDPAISFDPADTPPTDFGEITPQASELSSASDSLPNWATEPQPGLEQSQQYEQAFAQAIRLENPPGDLLRRGLQQLQQSLGLSETTVGAIEQQVANSFQSEQAQYRSALERYEQEYLQEAALGLPLSPEALDHLAELRRSFNLRDQDIKQVEGKVLSHFLIQPFPTEFSDSPPTKLTSVSSEALTEMPPHEAISFISATEMPPLDATPFQPNSASEQVNGEVSLRSEKGVDYVPLRDLLRAARWQEADEATLTAMLAAADRTEQGWLDPDSLLRFPCLDLQTIDRLWSYYSNDKFGFTAQWRSYPIPKLSKATTSFQPSRVTQEHTLKFVKDMGWWAERVEFLKYYNQLIFTLNDAPRGQLPALWYWAVPWWKAIQNGGIGSTRGGCNADDQTISIFMSRLKACGFE